MKRLALLLLPLAFGAWPAAAQAAPAVTRPAAVQAAPENPAEIHLAVVACGDRLDEALVMLQSAVRSARGHLTFHIFADDELRPRFQERLAAWPAAARAKFTPVLYPISYPGVEDPEKWRALFKPCASQRLFFPDLITSTERLLYVDTDILFLRPVDELWRLFDRFTPEQLAALAPEGEVAALNWYKRFAKHPYVQPLGVNSGVMLMDLEKMRGARWRERMLAYRKQYTAIPWGDQDLINIFFAESPDKLYPFSCAWNFRPDHCMYGSNCKAAEEAGVAVVHGNRQSFHGDEQPTFRAVYDAFAAHGLAADAGALGKTLESGLAAVAGQSACGKVSPLFTAALAALADPAPRSAAEDLHALFLFTNVDRKPALQAKFSLAIESLLRHLALPAGARLTLHFVADPGSKAYGETFLAAYRRPDIRFVFHDKDAWTAEIFPLVEDMQKHFSSGKGSYYNDSIFFLSLGMHRLLPPEIERIVKLDFDVRFEANLYLLFQEFDRFGPQNLIGLGPELQPVYRHVLGKYRHDHPGTRLGSPGPAGFPGFNAGVTMLDLGKLRRSEVYARALAPQAVAALAETYRFKGHLGDQDFYTLLAFEHEELFYKLDCGWNRQLCTWWKDKGYADVFDPYHQCPAPVKMYHGNCSTPIPPIQAERAAPASPLHEATEPAGEEAGFYRDVAAAQLAPWRQTGIRRADLDQARALDRPLVKYQIRGGRLYRDEKCYFPPRCAGIEHFLLEVAPELPDLEFLVNVQDHPVTTLARPLPVFSFSKIPAEHADILYPAWAFWEGGPAVKVIPSWRWDLNRRDLLAAGDALTWEEKKPAVFFRGSRTNETRDPYVLHSQKHPGLWDVRYTLNQSQRQTDHVTRVLGITPAEPVPPRDHCAWRYLLNFDGVAASFRLKNILACGGLVFYVEPKWVEFFYPKLVPGEHYVPLSLDIAEAARTVDALRADDTQARRIARNGRDFIEQHLTLAHVRRYWRDLLADYAALQRFEPKPDPGLVLIHGN
jgi:lipopolysaccharide biosynthesis glycosyltransferase